MFVVSNRTFTMEAEQAQDCLIIPKYSYFIELLLLSISTAVIENRTVAILLCSWHETIIKVQQNVQLQL